MNLLEKYILLGNRQSAIIRLEGKFFDRDELNPALIAAALTGNHEMIRLLVEAGADRNFMNRALSITGPEGETSYKLRDELCREAGIQSSVVSQQKNRAQKDGDYLLCTKILLSNGADVSTENYLPLKQASLRYRVKSIRVLLDHVKDLSLISLNELFRFDAFEKAMQLPEKVELLKLFIEGGINVNLDGGETLSRAALHGYDDFVHLLLDAGAELSHTYGQLSLIYAAESGNVGVVELLRDSGADINDEDLLYAAAGKGQNEVLKFLFERGAGDRDPEYVDLALEGAAEVGKLSTVKLLLKMGANPDANGGMAKKLASDNGHTKISEVLMNHKVDQSGK